MSILETTLLSNAILVVPLGLIVFVATRFVRRPAIAWCLWGLVLLKFVTPAVVPLPLPMAGWASAEPTDAADQSRRLEPVGDVSASGSAVPVVGTLSELATEPYSSGTIEPVLLPISDAELTITGTVADVAEPGPSTISQFPAVSPLRTTVVSNETTRSALDWRRMLWGIWLGGSVLIATSAAWRIWQFRRLVVRADRADDSTVALAKSLSGSLGLRQVPELRLTLSRIPPLLWTGLGRACVLLPRDLYASLDSSARRTLLAHELAHLARRDHWTRWFELSVQCLYWWHPVAWWAGGRLREAEEQCCDARVVDLLPELAATYANTILTTVDYLSTDSRPIPALATGMQPLRRSVRPLHRRLTMICDSKVPGRMSWRHRLLLLAVGATLLPLSLQAESEPDPTGATQETSFILSGSAAALPADTESDNVSFDPDFKDSERNKPPGRVPDETDLQPDATSRATHFVQSRSSRAVRVREATPSRLGGSNPFVTGGEGEETSVVEPAAVPGFIVPGEFEEITVVAREYEMPYGIAAAWEQFLGSTESALPFLVTLVRTLDEDEMRSESPWSGSMSGIGMGGFARSGPDAMHPSVLRVVVPVEAQEVIAKLIDALQKKRSPDSEAEQIILARARYTLPHEAAGRLVELLRAYHDSEIVTPLVVRQTGSDVMIITYREVHEQISQFIEFLAEAAKSARTAPQRGQTSAFGDSFSKSPASREVLDLDLNIARKKLEIATERVADSRKLFKHGVLSQADLDVAELKLLEAQREVKQLETLIDQADDGETIRGSGAAQPDSR